MRSLYGRVLRAARRKRQIHQQPVAEFLGMGQPNLSDIERGKHVGPEPTQELADFLDTDLDYLLAAWKLSQPLQIQLQNEDRAGRRYWFHHVVQREGLAMSQEDFDRLMVEHVDPDHMKGGQK